MASTDSATATGGLRDRKRRETRTRLADAALSLALSDGIEHATIDQISERAGVSRRTFFNYFDSKEDALLVTAGFELDDAMLAEHAERYGASDTIESLVGLLFIVAEPILIDTAANVQRGEIIRRYPQLVAKQLELMARMGTDVVAVAARVVSDDPRWSELDLNDGTLQTFLALCSSALQQTSAAVIAGTDTTDIAELERRCVELVRVTLARVS